MTNADVTLTQRDTITVNHSVNQDPA